MNIDRAVLLFAGFMVTLSVALTWWVSSGWLLLGLFVGVNLMQASLTGFCPLARILALLGLRPGKAFK